MHYFKHAEISEGYLMSFQNWYSKISAGDGSLIAFCPNPGSDDN